MRRFESFYPYMTNIRLEDGISTNSWPSNSLSGAIYTNSPVVTRRVVSTIKEYDQEGRLVKETTTEETHTTGGNIYPNVLPPAIMTNAVNETGGVIGSQPGSYIN